MKEQLLLLYKLQQTDSQIQADKAGLANLDDGTTLTTELEAHKAQLQDQEDELAAAQAQLHDKQLQLQGVEDERQQKWDRAYGGTVSDVKELAALEQKIAELDRRKGNLEEDIIMLLDDVETWQENVSGQRSQLQQTSNKLKEVQQHFAQRTEELTAELEHLAQQCTELVDNIGSSLINEYERLCKRCNGVGVAVAVDGACRVCHTTVASNLLGELESPSRIIKCENCRRILVLEQWVEF